MLHAHHVGIRCTSHHFKLKDTRSDFLWLDVAPGALLQLQLSTRFFSQCFVFLSIAHELLDISVA